MSASYWVYRPSSADTIAQINSEQSALLTSLGLTLTDRGGIGFDLQRSESNNVFKVSFTNNGTFYIYDHNNVQINSTSGTLNYAGFLCTANSIMILKDITPR